MTHRTSIARTSEAPFNGHGRINPDATFGDLLKTVFEHGDGEPDNIASAAHFIVRDNLSIIEQLAARDACGNEDLIASLALRTEYLLQIVPELERRMQEAECQAEEHEADDWELFKVPTANGVPRFDLARPAHGEDLLEAGYINRDRALDAISSLIKSADKDTPANRMRRKIEGQDAPKPPIDIRLDANQKRPSTVPPPGPVAS